MSRIAWAAALGLVTGIAGLGVSFVPSISTLEEAVGLRSLFVMRGAVAPPRHVVIVSIDESTAVRMGLPPLLRDWPRSVHATLVDRLVERGVSAIAFDIQFFRHAASAADDQRFAEALARARRVVLVQRLESVSVGGSELWERQEPVPPLADAAMALAPAAIPDLPVVSWSWTFLSTPHGGPVPSLAAVTIQVAGLSVIEPLLRVLAESGIGGLDSLPRSAGDIRRPSDLLNFVQQIRRQALAHPSAMSRALSRVEHADGLSANQRRQLLALMSMYAGEDSVYLNWHGPPGTICTIPYEAAIRATSESEGGCALPGAIVFVGMGNARVARAGQVDTYHAPYSGRSGVDFSGVEIHATALSNLLTQTALRPAGPLTSSLVLLAIGMLWGAAGYWVRTRRRLATGTGAARVHAAAIVGSLAALYGIVGYVLFRDYYLIVPLLVPLAMQLPLAVLVSLLAPPVVHETQVTAICLATDAAGSTALGQRLPHREYAQLMNDYIDALSQPVWAHGGVALPPEGDGFIGLWCTNTRSGPANAIDAQTRLQACRAALDITEAADRFDRRQADGQQLPTRVGLTIGRVTVHSDADRGIFKVFGDAVNLAARLRDLSRAFGARVVAAEEVISGLEGPLALNPISAPIELKGVDRALNILEIRVERSATSGVDPDPGGRRLRS